MTETAASPNAPVTVPARSNVYTVLVLLAFIVLALGVAFVAMRNNQLYGSALPLQPPAAASSSGR